MQLLKRHPYAALFILLLTILDSFDKDWWKMEGTPRHESYFGLSRGSVVWGYYTHPDDSRPRIFYSWNPEGTKFHAPTLGRKLEWGGISTLEGYFEAAIPLWIPFLGVVAWIAISEWRRRKSVPSDSENLES
jgi:hypothetical protein